jgi:hypothetical protein
VQESRRGARVARARARRGVLTTRAHGRAPHSARLSRPGCRTPFARIAGRSRPPARRQCRAP